MHEGHRHLGRRVKARPRLLLWLLSLATLTLVAATLDNPGSLDACYHFHVAQNLAAGRGLVEDVIWNYLDKSPAALALPHASHLYWMPLTTWLSWLGIVCFGSVLGPFAAAQLPFVLLASLLPLLSHELARALWGRSDHAWMAGLLTLLAPSYLQAWVVPEPATPFCLATAGCFLACARASQGASWGWLLAGGAAAAAHLTRADGALVLAAAAFAALRPLGWRRSVPALLLLGSGYLSIMAPWFARNLRVIGAPLPLSVASTAWLRGYDEIFSYQTPLTFERWLSTDAGSLLFEKLSGAVGALVHVSSIFQWVLPPLALMGYASVPRAKRRLLAPCGAYAVLLLASMSLIFTLPAQYGSLFRGAAALVPWGMALVPEGVQRTAQRYATLRRAPVESAQRAFRGGLLLIVLLVAVVFHVHRLRGVLPNATELWNQRLDHYVLIEAFLRERAASGGPVLVVDPPGFTLATGRPSIVVPSDGSSAIRAAADRFGARFLIVESNVPSLDAVWRSAAPIEGFAHVREFRDAAGSAVRLLERTKR